MTKGRATNAKANRTRAVRKTTAWRQARTGEARPRRLRRTRARWKQSASKASKETTAEPLWPHPCCRLRVGTEGRSGRDCGL